VANEDLSNADLELLYLTTIEGAAGPSLADAREQIYTPNEHAYFAALSGLSNGSTQDHALAYYRSLVSPDDLSLADTARLFWIQEIDGGAPPDVTAPSTPTNLVATPTGDTTVSLSWTASTDNVAVTGYEYRVDGGSAVDAGAGTSESVSGLTAATTYTFEVRAYDAAGNRSGWSASDDATTTGGGSSATIALVSSGVDDASSSSYTFAAQNLGAAAADRLIAVCVSTRGNNDIDSLSVAGVAATLVVSSVWDAMGQACIYVAAVPAGTTGDIVVGATSGVTRMTFAAYRMTGVDATATSTQTTLGGNITAVDNGVLLACSTVYWASGESECTWSPVGIVEQADLIADGIINHSSGYDDVTAAGTFAVTPTWSNQTDDPKMAVAAFPPA
jgi:chitodextrinase